MEKKTKIKLQNTAEQTGAAIGLTALAVVASAIGPVVNTIQQAKKLKKTKLKTGEITMDDLKEALKSYATNFLPAQRSIVQGTTEMFDDVVKKGKKRLADYDAEIKRAAAELSAKQAEAKRQEEIEAKREANNARIAAANTPEKLAETGVASVLTLIDNAPEITSFSSWTLVDEYKKLESELNSLINSEENHSVIIKIGNVYISREQHTVYIKMSDNSVKTLVFPKEQFSSIAEHTNDRVNKLKKEAKEAAVVDFTAAIKAQMAQSTK